MPEVVIDATDDPVITGDIGCMGAGIIGTVRTAAGPVAVGSSVGGAYTDGDELLLAGIDCGLALIGGGGSGAIFGPGGGGARRGGSDAGDSKAMLRLKDDVARCPGFVSGDGTSTSDRKSRSSVDSASDARSEEDDLREKRLRKRETADGAGAGAGKISGPLDWARLMAEVVGTAGAGDALWVICIGGGVGMVGDLTDAGDARDGVRGGSMLARGVPGLEVAAEIGGVADLLPNREENKPLGVFRSVGESGSTRSSLGRIFQPMGTTASSLYSGRALTDASHWSELLDDAR